MICLELLQNVPQVVTEICKIQRSGTFSGNYRIIFGIKPILVQSVAFTNKALNTIPYD